MPTPQHTGTRPTVAWRLSPPLWPRASTNGGPRRGTSKSRRAFDDDFVAGGACGRGKKPAVHGDRVEISGVRPTKDPRPLAILHRSARCQARLAQIGLRHKYRHQHRQPLTKFTKLDDDEVHEGRCITALPECVPDPGSAKTLLSPCAPDIFVFVNGWRLLPNDIAAASTRGQSSSLACPVPQPLRTPSLSPRDQEPARASGRPLLCISDIHGDLWALESVLAAVKHLNLCGIVVAGDHCVGGSQPFEVFTRLISLGAHLARGPSDLALGALAAGILDPTPGSASGEARLMQFLRAQKALGDVLCRRLADLPSTLVVSLDDTSGVMAMHGSPIDDSASLQDDDSLADHVACVAEDVLVTGSTHQPFARAVERPDAEPLPQLNDDGEPVALGSGLHPLLVVNCGSVGMSPRRRKDQRRTAHAVLLAPCADGRVHAWSQDILIIARARARSVG